MRGGARPWPCFCVVTINFLEKSNIVTLNETILKAFYWLKSNDVNISDICKIKERNKRFER